MSAPAPAPAKSSGFLKATSFLNFLVNLISMGALIGVLVLLVRVNSTLGKMQTIMADGRQTVEISQGGYGTEPVEVRLVDSLRSGIGSSSNPIYVRGSS